MGQYAEWEIEDEIFDMVKPHINKSSILTSKNKNSGVRNYIINNSSHIKGFNKKQTAFDDYQKRINKIIRMYCPEGTLKQATLLISDNFQAFKVWFKTIQSI